MVSGLLTFPSLNMAIMASYLFTFSPHSLRRPRSVIAPHSKDIESYPKCLRWVKRKGGKKVGGQFDI